VTLSHRPRRARRHVVLVGKGITFDSGGLSLKPLDAMKPMKTDMAGGAAVLAVMRAVPKLCPATAVTALVPLAENLPGADATRPSDVIRHYGGRTTEVINTDAEGRLVLADAIAFAAATIKPDAIVDLATLTGAATQALGRRYGALFSTAEPLRDGLLRAADAAGERLWPMPLVEDYRDSLASPVADLRNIAEPELHYSGGSVIAALFLREFTGGLPWAHLDIAGPARADADDEELTKGATGFGVRTLLRWLADSERA
jgi:leucyl aminopeptidase